MHLTAALLLFCSLTISASALPAPMPTHPPYQLHMQGHPPRQHHVILPRQGDTVIRIEGNKASRGQLNVVNFDGDARLVIAGNDGGSGGSVTIVNGNVVEAKRPESKTPKQRTQRPKSMATTSTLAAKAKTTEAGGEAATLAAAMSATEATVAREEKVSTISADTIPSAAAFHAVVQDAASATASSTSSFEGSLTTTSAISTSTEELHGEEEEAATATASFIASAESTASLTSSGESNESLLPETTAIATTTEAAHLESFASVTAAAAGDGAETTSTSPHSEPTSVLPTTAAPLTSSVLDLDTTVSAESVASLPTTIAVTSDHASTNAEHADAPIPTLAATSNLVTTESTSTAEPGPSQTSTTTEHTNESLPTLAATSDPVITESTSTAAPVPSQTSGKDASPTPKPIHFVLYPASGPVNLFDDPKMHELMRSFSYGHHMPQEVLGAASLHEMLGKIPTEDDIMKMISGEGKVKAAVQPASGEEILRMLNERLGGLGRWQIE
ncbi:hypothetical protein HDU96_009007 [Phlyctochytrium bullatum]|nr:hypothetical protein HDU96_009007 [Phlyctochytrium bullatum]